MIITGILRLKFLTLSLSTTKDRRRQNIDKLHNAPRMFVRAWGLIRGAHTLGFQSMLNIIISFILLNFVKLGLPN